MDVSSERARGPDGARERPLGHRGSWWRSLQRALGQGRPRHARRNDGGRAHGAPRRDGCSGQRHSPGACANRDRRSGPDGRPGERSRRQDLGRTRPARQGQEQPERQGRRDHPELRRPRRGQQGLEVARQCGRHRRRLVAVPRARGRRRRLRPRQVARQAAAGTRPDRDSERARADLGHDEPGQLEVEPALAVRVGQQPALAGRSEPVRQLDACDRGHRLRGAAALRLRRPHRRERQPVDHCGEHVARRPARSWHARGRHRRGRRSGPRRRGSGCADRVDQGDGLDRPGEDVRRHQRLPMDPRQQGAVQHPRRELLAALVVRHELLS